MSPCKSTLVALSCVAISAWCSAEAFPILSDRFNPTPPGLCAGGGYLYVRSFNNWIHYDPATHLLAIPGIDGSEIQLGDCNQASDFQGKYSLFMDADPNRQSSGGIFSIYGAAPDFGIDQPTELLAATVIAAALGYGPSGEPPIQEFAMGIDYLNPALPGNWGPYLILEDRLPDQYNMPNGGYYNPELSDSNLFSEPWEDGPLDAWDFYSVGSLPEPGTLALFAVALAALGGVAVRRRREV